jgi:hypothetical protein
VSEDPAVARTDEALERSGLADMRPAYRKLLVQLKSSDPAAFEEATRRYQDDLEPAIGSGERDPVAAWLEYGAWLAARFADGRAVAIDATGRARDYEPGESPGAGDMILFLPGDDRAPVTLLAVPAEPTDPQRETATLLAG